MNRPPQKCWPPIDERTKVKTATLSHLFDWSRTLGTAGRNPIVESVWGIEPFGHLAAGVERFERLLMLEPGDWWKDPYAPFDVIVGAEQMNVHDVTLEGQAFRVLRGVNGTMAEAHPAGSLVQRYSALRITHQSITPRGKAGATFAYGVAGKTYTVVNRILAEDGKHYERCLRIAIT